MMKFFLQHRLGSLALALCLLTGNSCVAATTQEISTKTFYRYVNEQGVKVIGQTIPPQYVYKGYEVISLTGEVLKVVPPSPDAADAARIAKEKKSAASQAKIDEQLRKSYSTPAEIDAAKIRNLRQLRNNIDVLKANLLSVRSQLKNQESLAANMERSGQKVSDEVMKNITTLRSEEKDLNVQIGQREQEYTAASDKFDEDKKRFIEITTPQASTPQ